MGKEKTKRGGSYSKLHRPCALSGSPDIMRTAPVAALMSARGTANDWPINHTGDDINLSMVMQIAPTRSNLAHIICGWHSLGYQGRCSVTEAKLHYCTVDPGSTANPDIDLNKCGIIKTESVWQIGEGKLFETWVELNDTYSKCYVIYDITYREDGHTGLRGAVIWSNDRLSSVKNIVGAAPSVTYDRNTRSVTIGTSMPGRRILEFQNTQATSPTGITDEETLRNFYLSSFIDLEGWGYLGYYYNSDSMLTRWSPGTYSVSFTDTNGDEFSSMVSEYLDHVIDEVNGCLGAFGVLFGRNDAIGNAANVKVKYGTMQSLWDETIEDLGYIHGGEWSTSFGNDGIITSATVEIAYEAHYFSTFSRLVLEEFYQMLGCGHDQLEYPMNTTTNDVGGPWNPDSLSDKDRDMLRLVYAPETQPGDSCTMVALVHNVPTGVKLASKDVENVERTVSLNFLKPSETYNVRAWIVTDDGEISETSDWTTITMPNGPSMWDWDASNGSASAEQTRKAYGAVIGKGAVSDFHHLVWNDLVDKIQEAAMAAGSVWDTHYATYEDAKMTPVDKLLTAPQFNAARQNVGSRVSTGISEVAKGDVVYGSYFITLADKLNEWINQI